MAGRLLTDKLIISFEIGVPIVRDYPVYNVKAELCQAYELIPFVPLRFLSSADLGP